MQVLLFDDVTHCDMGIAFYQKRFRSGARNIRERSGVEGFAACGMRSIPVAVFAYELRRMSVVKEVP